MNTLHFWQLILGTVVALLPVINPVASAPVVLTITEGDSEARRIQQVKQGCCYMVIILVACLFGGGFIIRFFGISIPGIRIAGGLLVSGIAMSMLAPPRQEPGERRRRDEARAKSDISLTPLAMPMLSGPGSIAMTIGFTSLANHWLDDAAIHPWNRDRCLHQLFHFATFRPDGKAGWRQRDERPDEIHGLPAAVHRRPIRRQWRDQHRHRSHRASIDPLQPGP